MMQENTILVSNYKKLIKNKSALFGLFVAFIIFFLAIFANLIAPYSPIQQNLDYQLLPPTWNSPKGIFHILGTDSFGRDILSRVIYGSRISIIIGIISVGISLIFGIILGSLSGYFGKKIDLIIMRLVDIMLSIPSMLLAIIIVSIIGPSLYNAMIAIGIVGIPVYARIVRASFLGEKNKEYVTSSKISGSSNFRIMFKVVFPNCLAPITVQSTMGFASAILEAAGLSFLGLGAQPPTPEWGAMLAQSLDFITVAPWVMIPPGVCIFLTVFAFNLVGDGLMDIIDPKLKDK